MIFHVVWLLLKRSGADIKDILAVLLAEVWQPLRRRDYHTLRSSSGVAPVTRRSSKTCVVMPAISG